MPRPKKATGEMALTRISADLSKMLTEVAKAEKRSVAELVDDSPLRVWALERKLKYQQKVAAEAAETTRTLAALRKKQG